MIDDDNDFQGGRALGPDGFDGGARFVPPLPIAETALGSAGRAVLHRATASGCRTWL